MTSEVSRSICCAGEARTVRRDRILIIGATEKTKVNGKNYLLPVIRCALRRARAGLGSHAGERHSD